MNAIAPFPVSAAEANATVTAVLRRKLVGLSWNQVRSLIAARRVKVLGELCLDPARRVKEGDLVELLARPAPRPPQPESIAIRYVDEHLVVVEKPAGLNSVRHPSELHWKDERKFLSPTLHDLVAKVLASQRQGRATSSRLRIVHRLDKETSGLLVFARSVAAERGLGKQFHAHSVIRRYVAVVRGDCPSQRIHNFLVRDRGDGRRGSGSALVGKEAITYVEALERLPGFTVVACRLETGRTHQIRIHLAELGHPVCGDRVYRVQPDRLIDDPSGALRLMLHACELGFEHPITGEAMRWHMPIPADMAGLIERLRRGGT